MLASFGTQMTPCSPPEVSQRQVSLESQVLLPAFWLRRIRQVVILLIVLATWRTFQRSLDRHRWVGM